MQTLHLSAAQCLSHLVNKDVCNRAVINKQFPFILC